MIHHDPKKKRKENLFQKYNNLRRLVPTEAPFPGRMMAWEIRSLSLKEIDDTIAIDQNMLL